MDLYLLRHGIAVEFGTPGYAEDSERPLTPEGERKLQDVCRAMKALDPGIDLVLSSPYVRARQTAEIVAQELRLRKHLGYCDHLVPGGSSRKLVEFIGNIKPAPGRLLLVGHEPMLSGLISLLVFGASGGAVTMKKAGLCKLGIDQLKHGRCATLEWLISPRIMGLMK